MEDVDGLLRGGALVDGFFAGHCCCVRLRGRELRGSLQVGGGTQRFCLTLWTFSGGFRGGGDAISGGGALECATGQKLLPPVRPRPKWARNDFKEHPRYSP